MRAWRLPVLTGALVLFPAALAHAEYRGTDLWGNIAPVDREPGLADRYPLSFYGLDSHVDGPSVGLGGVGTGDVPAMIAQFIASLLFQVTVWMTKVVIDIFDFAFSLDLLNGPGGALAPIGDATQTLYGTTLAPFLGAAVVLLGLWALHKGIIERRFSDTASGIGMSVLLVVIAMTIILKPEATIGTASSLTNTLSDALLAGATGDSTGARVRAEDHLFKTFVYNPWVALEFGGLSHCVGAETDDDGFPKPVAPNSPDRVTCRDHVKSIGGFGGYAPRFLQHPPGSDERDAMYEALKNGEENSTWPGWSITKADAPGVDIQQAGGAFQRLALAVLIFAGALGAVLLLGMLAFAALLAQVIALVLLAFAPVALLAGVFPGWGHKLFRAWLGKLGLAVFIKAVYSLLLAVLIGVSLALETAAGVIGFLFAFGLQAAFFWIVFLKRKALAGVMLTRRETTRIERTTREAVATPVAAAAGVGWAGGVAAARAARGRGQDDDVQEQQEHAPRPGRQAPAPAPAEEVVAATPGTTRARKTQPPVEEAERVPARAPEPARGAREELVVALEAASEKPAEPPAPTPTGPGRFDPEQRPPQRPVAEVIGPARAPASQERAERPAGMGHLARPEGEQPERIRTPEEER